VSASWTLLLCDSAWNGLAELTTASGRTIDYRRNSYAEAACVISHDDDAAPILFDALRSGIPRLKAYRRSDGASSSALRFAGYLAPFTEGADEAAFISLVFRSPFGRLIGDGTGRGRFTAASVAYPATDAGTIATSLITTTNADSPTDLTVGGAQVTKTRDRAYQFANVGEAIINLTNVLDGFDFEEAFTETGATFNVWAALGQDRPAAQFQYGAETLSNVRAMARTTQPPINRATVVGANGLYALKQDLVSQAAYGLWPAQASASDVTEQATLDDKAQAMLRPDPVKTVTFQPEFGLESCPRVFDDFALGDTVRFYARRGALTESVSTRVNGFKVVIDEDGFEASEIADPAAAESIEDVPSFPSSESGATIPAEMSVEIVED
jgi:hypothetical protein